MLFGPRSLCAVMAHRPGGSRKRAREDDARIRLVTERRTTGGCSGSCHGRHCRVSGAPAREDCTSSSTTRTLSTAASRTAHYHRSFAAQEDDKGHHGCLHLATTLPGDAATLRPICRCPRLIGSVWRHEKHVPGPPRFHHNALSAMLWSPCWM